MDKYNEILKELTDYKAVFKNAKIAYKLNEIRTNDFKSFIIDLIQKIETLMKENESLLISNQSLQHKLEQFITELKSCAETIGFEI